MREISPALGISADEFLRQCPPEIHRIAAAIRRQKEADNRPRPSATVIDASALLTRTQRHAILDSIASLVDENLFGRSEMCIQFADLLQRALAFMGLSSRSAVGTAIYFSEDGKEIFRWKHAWVRVGEEVIDGNVDSLFENPLVPKAVNVAPYWGPIRTIPKDRRLREDHDGGSLPFDEDVSNIWWPELCKKLSEKPATPTAKEGK